jgi:hypothetical protein
MGRARSQDCATSPAFPRPSESIENPMRIGAACGMMIACVAAGAAAQQGAGRPAAEIVLPAVSVAVLRDPVDKSYRKMLKGMDLFQEMHGMAPAASLRFRLLPRQVDTDMNGIVLAIDADSLSIPVRLEPDRSFTLERHQKALDEDAAVRSNRKALSMTWRADVRTPGLPPNTRRLGDLRLECHVGMEAELVSNNRPSFFSFLATTLMREAGYCDKKRVHYLFFADRPLFSVALVSGGRREILPVGDLYAGLSENDISDRDLPYCDCQVLLDRTYYLPLGDRSWPDDTLVEFEYMDDDASSSASEPPTGGPAKVIRFDSGYEVWIYQLPGELPAKGKAALKTELVVLFAPSGTVTKTRISSRPAAA